MRAIGPSRSKAAEARQLDSTSAAASLQLCLQVGCRWRDGACVAFSAAPRRDTEPPPPSVCSELGSQFGSALGCRRLLRRRVLLLRGAA